jgi:hypothetical protein
MICPDFHNLKEVVLCDQIDGIELAKLGMAGLQMVALIRTSEGDFVKGINYKKLSEKKIIIYDSFKDSSLSTIALNQKADQGPLKTARVKTVFQDKESPTLNRCKTFSVAVADLTKVILQPVNSKK